MAPIGINFVLHGWDDATFAACLAERVLYSKLLNRLVASV
jgi:hypothetical protein